MLEVNVDNIMPVTAVRDSLNKIIDDVEGSDELVLVTKNGAPAAIIVGVQHLEKLTGVSHKKFMPDTEGNNVNASSGSQSAPSATDDDTTPDKKDDLTPPPPITPNTPANSPFSNPDKPLDFSSSGSTPSTNFVFDDNDGLKTTDGKQLANLGTPSSSGAAPNNGSQNQINGNNGNQPVSSPSTPTASQNDLDNIFKPFSFDDEEKPLTNTPASSPAAPGIPNPVPATPTAVPSANEPLSPLDEPLEDDETTAPVQTPVPPQAPLSPAPSAGGMPLGTPAPTQALPASGVQIPPVPNTPVAGSTPTNP